jgi:hypothetical protein
MHGIADKAIRVPLVDLAGVQSSTVLTASWLV